MVANLAQSSYVVEANTGDLVDVVLHGQLIAVQIDTDRPGRQRRTRSQTHRLEFFDRKRCGILVKLTREPKQMNSDGERGKRRVGGKGEKGN